MDEDFRQRMERVAGDRPPQGRAVRSARSGGPGLTPLLFGVIWGAAVTYIATYLNENHDAIKAAAEVESSAALPMIGGLLFILGSLALVAIGLLRRLFSARMRARRGWGMTIGFVVGFAIPGMVKLAM